MFRLVMLKYVFGTAHHLLIPISILIVRPDLRKLGRQVFWKGGTSQNDTKTITVEEMGKLFGFGLQH